MDTQSPLMINDLYQLTLVDGLPAQVDGKTIKYLRVRLRETTVADEREAARLAERVMLVGGVHKLLVSESDFRYALTMRHVDWLECDGEKLHGAMLDLALFGKLTPHDLALIEERVVLVELAAQVRYGVLTQAQFDDYAAGRIPAAQAGALSPQPVGQAAELGAHAARPESGPAMLADYVGDAAAGASARDAC